MLEQQTSSRTAAPPPPASRTRPRWLRLAIPAVLVGLAGLLTLLELDRPARIFFDETYYVNDARSYLQRLVEDSFAVHPPVGKWLIAAGIRLFGDNPVGWRVAGAAEASLAVLLTYLAGRRLFVRLWPAALAGLLLATDGLWISQARTAMLDIHLAFFVVLGAWLLLVDRDRTASRDARTAGGLGHPRHPFRLLAGVSFGLAIAAKWSGVLALGAAGVVVLGWEMARRHRATGRALAEPWPAVRSIAGGLVVVPAVVYLAAWVPWLIGFEGTEAAQDRCGGTPVAECRLSVTERLEGLAEHHVEVLDFHLDLRARHSYRAPAWTWPVMGRPVVYYWETCPEERAERSPRTEEDGSDDTPDPCRVEPGQAAEILDVGNPALWWSFLPAVVLLAAGLRRRDGRAGFIAAFWALQFAPWLLVSRPAFFFYMVPVVPFLALGVAYGTVAVEERRPLLWPGLGALAGGLVGLATGWGLGHVAPLRSPDARWIGLGIGALLGAWLLGRGRDGPEPGGARPIPGAPSVRRLTRGRLVAAVIAVAAVALLVYFYPVWTALPLPEEWIRQRWWFRSWI